MARRNPAHHSHIHIISRSCMHCEWLGHYSRSVLSQSVFKRSMLSRVSVFIWDLSLGIGWLISILLSGAKTGGTEERRKRKERANDAYRDRRVVRLKPTDGHCYARWIAAHYALERLRVWNMFVWSRLGLCIIVLALFLCGCKSPFCM